MTVRIIGTMLLYTVEPSDAPRTLVLNQQAIKQGYNYATDQQEKGNLHEMYPYYIKP